jgi:three-Cys-motif partner protein
MANSGTKRPFDQKPLLRITAMGHKADKSFFAEKRQWSKRKDKILENYLVPYLQKVKKLRKPILIVDCFAGPGRFGDGELGSPLIICQSIQKALSQGLSVPISALFIEADQELYSDLNSVVGAFPFAKTIFGKFDEHIQEIEEKAKDHSVFLYVDPYTVEGLDWYQMYSVFQHLSTSNMSIEILLNFNARSFVRRGLAALKLVVPESNPEIEDLEEIDAHITTPPSVKQLNNVVGSEWWQNILGDAESFPKKVQLLTNGVCEQLSKKFNYVCQHAVKALPRHTVPKYYLIFGSRHPDALRLMNDEMIKSQRTFAELAKPEHPTLFEMRPVELVPDIEMLPPIILKHASQPAERGLVILNVIRECFCQFSSKEIRGCIEQLLKEGKLKSETGKVRINDNIKIFATQ